MSEPAHDYKAILSTSTEGLEDLFSSQNQDVQDSVLIDNPQVLDTVRQELTVVQAANLGCF